ncbi:MAG: hypothetical protein QHI48_10575 [Bacteroidota bacterium]|nr:hypothetical protein [Bacteroidota bacterium]
MTIPIRAYPPDSLEAKVYRAVEDIPTEEPNDRLRLGYNIYLFATRQYPTLRESIHVAQARLLIPTEEAYQRIAERLRQQGIPVVE